MLIGAGVAYMAWRYVAEPYDSEQTRLYIPSGINADSVRTILCDALGRSYGSKVATIWEHSGGTPARAHGSYVVEPDDPAYIVARIIEMGRQTPIRFTFNNLRTFDRLAGRVGTAFETDSASFAAVADSILAEAGYTPEQYAAAVLPDTYEFYWTASPANIANKLLNTRDRFWTQERLEQARALGLDPVQVATLASIVEEETNKPDERGKVARLYLNRLSRGMALQADPTVKFALGDFGLRRITAKHLGVDSPYNTYRVVGLPPGPIRIAEGATIDAVLSAPMHNYLYMCAKADFSGYHDFAETYDRHRINSARYHRALDSRGIR